MQRLFVTFALCLPLSAAIADADLIARALAYAKSSKSNPGAQPPGAQPPGAQPKDELSQHCRERALSFAQSPPPTGKSENLNNVKITRGKTVVVIFSHLGAAYDGVNCKVTVELSTNGTPIRISTEYAN